MAKGFDESVANVVQNGNCSGCGICSIISPRIKMKLDERGFMRPNVSSSPRGAEEVEAEAVRLFRRVCPGVGLVAPLGKEGSQDHPIFGVYISAWQGWAVDPEVRFLGSSAGVLTALTAWMIVSGRALEVIGSASSPTSPSRTTPVRITSRAEALASSGSRYGPVANASALNIESLDTPFIGKPCEVSAVSQLLNALEHPAESRPIMLSFFCAGTPSQNATDGLVSQLGVAVEDVDTLRYRGNGWPGEFQVTNTEGIVGRLSYDESWGKHLGRNIQSRCKICVDGTGGHADIAVGDYWKSDDRGFPLFNAADGISAIIARTARGATLLTEAVDAGILCMQPLKLDEVASIQPLQRDRKKTLFGRLAGRFLAGKAIPDYVGYSLAALAFHNTGANLRAALGSFRRGLREK